MRHYFGVDLGQINYYAAGYAKGPNLGLFYQYKHYRFLSLNASCFYNDISGRQRSYYDLLTDYRSFGGCLKLGFDASLRINRARTTRLFFGYQEALLKYHEEGSFSAKDQYWPDYEYRFRKSYKPQFATEFILGLSVEKKRLTFRAQIYHMFDDHIRRIEKHDEIVPGYKSVFFPGFGFRKTGLNFLLLYRLI